MALFVFEVGFDAWAHQQVVVQAENPADALAILESNRTAHSAEVDLDDGWLRSYHGAHLGAARFVRRIEGVVAYCYGTDG